MLKNGFNNFMQEVAEKAVKCMSDKYTDNDKSGIVLSMVLDTKDAVEKYLEVVDKLNETNQQLLAQNKELLRKLEDLQKQTDTQFDSVNGLYTRLNLIENKLEYRRYTGKKYKEP